MISVKKGNVVLDITPDEKAYYMEKGYSVIDGSGKVIEEAIPQDVATLQVQNAQLRARIAELEKQLAEKQTTEKPKTRTKSTKDEK